MNEFLNEMILDEYKNRLDDFKSLEEIVFHILKTEFEQNNIHIMSIEHRIKEEQSLLGKLEKKFGKYHSLNDITDILGFRIICYFSDEVDKVTSIIDNLFCVDKKNSIDKGAALSPTAFGYLSVHYICSLKQDSNYNEELKSLKFEVQMRSTLQHVWAEIEHDLGYKSEFAIPRNIRRDFSRVAGLLEIADSEFVKMRYNLDEYGNEIRQKIKDNDVDSITIDLLTLKEYMKSNLQMSMFIKSLATICNAEIQYINPEAYIAYFNWLGLKTLGDISNVINTCGDIALKIAQKTLSGMDLDILSTNAALRYLCHGYLKKNNYTLEQIEEYMLFTIKQPDAAKRQAIKLYEMVLD